MGRPKRIWYPGATYHIVVRGNRKQDIFMDINDRLIFLQKISWIKSKINFYLHSYVLMTNHFHLLLETVDVDISDIMRNLNSFYTRFFNKKYDLVGHLFQGRYRSVLVEKEAYLMEVSRYIHLNPVRAGIVKNPEDYRWSSFQAYMGKTDTICYCDKILEMIGDNDKPKNYRNFIYEKLEDKDYSLESQIAEGDIMGSPAFVKEKQQLYQVPGTAEIREDSTKV